MKSLSKHITEALDHSKTTYRSLAPELISLMKPFEKYCVEGGLTSSASGWTLDHPDGSMSLTFWLKDNSVDKKKIIEQGRKFAKKHNLIIATFYANGPEQFDRSAQNWGNAPARIANYVYGLTFYTKANTTNRYTEL